MPREKLGGPSAMSFAYERRGELPDSSRTFYGDAGKARTAFGQAATSHPERESPASQDTASLPRPARFNLPEPRPPFAVPVRRPVDQTQVSPQVTNQPARPMQKEEFIKARLSTEFCARSRSIQKSHDL